MKKRLQLFMKDPEQRKCLKRRFSVLRPSLEVQAPPEPVLEEGLGEDKFFENKEQTCKFDNNSS